ncbi:MAG: polysaccharide deacetylase family protein [Deltaproteobacteria bacterium]|nr:polysaccharide deacetylase family protein [Deltaproteobacteria bacterium]
MTGPAAVRRLPPAPPVPVYASSWGRPVLAGLWLATVLVAAGFGLSGASISVLWPLGALGALLAWVGAGVRFAEIGVFARPLLCVAGTPGRLALTFDDGPHPVHTPRILELLADAGHQATFFVIGERAARYPELVRDMARRGHLVANHSLRHQPWTPALPAAMLAREWAAANRQIAELTGRFPRWMRAPVGLVSPPVAVAAQRCGLQLVHWSATARDGVAWADRERCWQRLRPGLSAGAIVVLHDGVGGETCAAVDLLPAVLGELKARGLHSVTLDALLGPPVPQ